MMGRNTLCNETIIALDNRRGSFLDSPLADIGERFPTNRCLLSGLRGCPPVFPTVAELF
jgi:hypothetical protein